MDRGACVRSFETPSPSTASHDRCRGCPNLNGRRLTTVRWQRSDSSRVNATEVLDFGDVKIFRPVESKWKQVIRKLKRFVGKVGKREENCEKGMRLGAASLVAACSLKNTKPLPISSPKPSIWQRRSSAPMPSLNVPNSRSSRSRNECP
ncbi:hypothetical protein SUGI_1056430 [Cryptomeria japonica]|nr:hypothetical protein SUGI_1056430 [Cryptomeria japonica]